MNPIEVYKLLPRTNCRRCPQGTCMAFAVALTRGEANPDECPEMGDDARKILSNIEVVDWKARLIERLRNEIKGMDLKKISRGIGAEDKNGDIVVRFFGAPYTIKRDGTIETKAYLNPWIEILLLHYVRTGGSGRPSGQWVSFSELKSGMVKATSFHRDCEEPLRELFDRDLEGTERFLLHIGAKRQEVEKGAHGWYLEALPKIPVLIIYWPGAGAEESRLKILFDRTADRFLDVESLVFVFEGLVNMIKKGGFRE